MDFLKKNNIIVKNENLLLTALTHASYANENHCESYERLEFLGDAVLQIIMSEYLYQNTDLKEGQMSKERSSYVCEEALACYAKKAGIDKYIRVGNGLLNNINDTIIADVFEAVLAAIYLDCGLETCKTYIYDVVIPYVKKNVTFLKDYKTMLQEMVQTGKKSLEYVAVETNADNNVQFKASVIVDGIILGTGVGHSKKEAEQKAAAEAIRKSAK